MRTVARTSPWAQMLDGPGTASVVLVIDDDVQVRSLICHYLKSAGYNVREASSAISAVACVQESDVKAVVLDLFMPGQDGFEVIRALWHSERKPKILAITGYAEPFLRIARELGADAVLSKPFGPDELLAKVRELLASSP
jgi:DNA-binding response OmpR family regulator